MSRLPIEFLLPGDLKTLTGGYIYDRHVVEGLRARGWAITVHSLDASFPLPTQAALDQAAQVLDGLADGNLVVVDGLALGGLDELLSAHRARLRLVGLVHHPLALETGLDAATARRLYQSERAALRHVSAVVVTSRWTLEALDDYDVGPDRIRVIEPGTSRGAMRSGPAARPHRLLCVASLTPRKGHLVLLDALARLGKSDWRLACAGSLTMDPDYVAEIRERIDSLGLGSRIDLLGELKPAALAELYAQADSFVLASFMEGYGMALTEAIAAGLPIVSTTAGAIPHVVPAAVSRLVAAGDRDALAGALAEIIDGGPAWRTLAAAAASATLPSWEDATQRFAALLERVSAQ